jgi:DNA-binding beta-propeller fold protein YncE
MKKHTQYLFFIILVAKIFVFSGCGTSHQIQQTDITWPAPPDEPRVQYVTTYKGEDDFRFGLGSILDFIGGSKGKSGLARPFDVCLDDYGRIYVSDVAQGVLVFNTMEKSVEVFGAKNRIPLQDARGIAYGHNKIFIGLADAGQIFVLDTGGTFLYAIGKEGQFETPVDVAIDTNTSRVLIVDNKQHKVLVFSETGDSLFSIGKRGVGDGDFNYPQSIAVDEESNIYVMDAFNFRVEIFDSEGKYLRQFGKQGNIFATFSRPKGIALDTYGNIYVLDANHNNVQIFDKEGSLLLFVGKYSTENDGFQGPVSIAIDRNNTIYVTDQINQRLQVFQLLKGN